MKEEKDIKIINNEKDNPFLTRGFISPPKPLVDNTKFYKVSCAKLPVQNFEDNIKQPINKVSNSSSNVYYEVSFKNSSKNFYVYNSENKLKKGDIVAVEANLGHDIGVVTAVGIVAEMLMNNKGVEKDSEQIKKIYRKVRNSDIEKWIASVNREEETAKITREVIKKLGLNMKLNDVEFQGDGTKATFYYTAEDRVDFRELIKILAEKFRIRIEMKQIGIRQEASRLGGVSSCGRELCCATWITKFTSVTTVRARVQQLTLNPVKLAGQCGKLKCCLNFEYDAYVDALQEFPDNTVVLKTKKGDASYVKSDVFKKLMWYTYNDIPDSTLMALHIDKVKEIIAMNNKGKTPKNIEDFATQTERKVDMIEEEVLVPDDLARFDD
ncbi:MAG: PSP1 domain-containing protein [Bacteroidales bacterium]|jgi:cell fate regulator YaaT (PSP1 superfamily)